MLRVTSKTSCLSPALAVVLLFNLFIHGTASVRAGQAQGTADGARQEPSSEQRAEELLDRYRQQLRSGLLQDAKRTVDDLKQAQLAQMQKCAYWWSLVERSSAGERLNSRETKALQVSEEFARGCEWRPDSLPYVSGDPAEDKTSLDAQSSRILADLNAGSARTPLFVEPLMSPTMDADTAIARVDPVAQQAVLQRFQANGEAASSLSSEPSEAANAVMALLLADAERLFKANPGGAIFIFSMLRSMAERLGDDDAALRHAQKELELTEQRFGAASEQVCAALWPLASLLLASGGPGALEAADRCLTAVASRRPDSVTHASALNNLGVVHHRRGDLERAVDAYQRSVARFDRNVAALPSIAFEHPLARVHSNLGLAYWQLGQVTDSYRHLQLARQLMRREGGSFVTERGAVAAMAIISAELDVLLTVEHAAKPSAVDLEPLALPMLLERKSLVLANKATTIATLARRRWRLNQYRTLLAQRAALARTVAGPERSKERGTRADELDLQIRQIEFEALQQVQMAQVAAPTWRHPQAEAYAAAFAKEVAARLGRDDRRLRNGTLDSATMARIQAEVENALAPRFKDYLNFLHQRTQGPREGLLTTIQGRLPKAAVLLEIVRFRPFASRGAGSPPAWGTARYGVYVIHATGVPRFVDYGEASRIDELVLEFRRTLAQPRGTLVRDLGRRLDAALMGPIREQLGAATQILISPDGALNLVPFGALIDEQDRFLIETHTFNYLSSGRDLLPQPSPGRPTGAPVVIADPAFDDAATPVPDSTAAARSQAPSGVRYARLPGTAAEAAAIRSVLANASIFSAASATETAVKDVASPSVLHIATHGFFLSEPATNPTSREPLLDDPMLRSGLVFAGANRGGSGSDDGVLTALEAAALTLAGTQLVVLSACDTGVGDVENGEGVFGLRRAFAVAGAETLVMSLWQVEDRATQELITEFYRRLARGEARADALRQASLTVMRDPARAHPFYWASFISAGAAGPLGR